MYRCVSDVKSMAKALRHLKVDLVLKIYAKELSFCNKSQFSNTNISTTKLCKPLIFQTLIV